MSRPLLLALELSTLVALGCDAPRTTAASAPDTSAAASAPRVVPADLPTAATSAAPSAKPPSAPPESVACQHVLVAYKGAKNAPGAVSRSKAEARARAEDVRKKALAGDDMAELAKTYSDDPGSRDRLGSVGKFKREGMVKAFSDAAFSLPVDGISEVVETPFGFHVLKRNQ